MHHVRLIVREEKRQSGANLRDEAKEKWAGPLGEKFRGLSNGLLPAGAHMDGHKKNRHSNIGQKQRQGKNSSVGSLSRINIENPDSFLAL